MSAPLKLPRRVPTLVDRAIRAGWEVELSRPDDETVDLVLREAGGRRYVFDLTWERDGKSWRGPRSQNVESVFEYINRTEKEQDHG